MFFFARDQTGPIGSGHPDAVAESEFWDSFTRGHGDVETAIATTNREETSWELLLRVRQFIFGWEGKLEKYCKLLD